VDKMKSKKYHTVASSKIQKEIRRERQSL